ncbi:hypothetical protein DD237_002653 [Peronospora effusa]|uniref:Heme oxygenase n=1 Tax=Peronospora effusa TaxID=542832 RepID=A0A425CLQ7_9STRA|nr:hypothetical protein DD237_002653 [Peronospora effusa]
METSPLLTEQMRAATREIHSISDKLVNLKLVVALMDKKLYGRALLLFYYVYVQLELIMKTHKNHAAFSGLYKIIDEIARADNIAKDLEFYLGEEWNTKYQPTQATQDYVKYVNSQNMTVFVSSNWLCFFFSFALELCEKVFVLLKLQNPTLVLPYCYHMYMAMLAGGVMIKKMVKRSFTPPEGQGLNCFAFNVDSNKALRHTIKDAINAVPHDEETKKLLLAESVTCFKLNNQIVQSLDGTGNHVMKFILKWMVIVGLILATFFCFYSRFYQTKLKPNHFHAF